MQLTASIKAHEASCPPLLMPSWSTLSLVEESRNWHRHLDKLQTNGKNRYIREPYRVTNEFKKDCQRRTNSVKDEKCKLRGCSYIILNKWKYHCSVTECAGYNRLFI